MKYPAYPNYKDSGVEWLGEVPEHWEVKRLKYSTSINDEALPETTDPEFEFVYVDIGSVSSIEGIKKTEKMLFESAPSRARRKVQPGDVIVSTVRTYLRAIAPIQESKEPLIVSTGFAVVRPQRIKSRYLAYALRSSLFVESVVARSVGVSYPAVNASEIGDIPIPLPSALEQDAIADFLDRETGRIDTLVAKKRRLIALLKEKRTALISRTVTRGLPADAAQEFGLTPHTRFKDSGIDWLGEVPEGWEMKRLKHVSQVRQGVTKGRDLTGKDVVELPYLRVANVQDGYLDLSDVATIAVLITEVDRYSLKKGDVLMNEGGDNDKLGRGAVWNEEITPCLHQNHVFCVRPSSPDLSRWISTWTQGAAAKHYFFLHAKQTTNLASISSSSLRELPLPLPPISEQTAIATYLDRETAKLDQLVEKIETAIARLQEYRTALITAAVTGKIDVRQAAGELAA